MYYFKLTSLNHIVLYKEVLSLNMLGFLVVFYVVRKVDRTLIVIVECRDKRVVIISFF